MPRNSSVTKPAATRISGTHLGPCQRSQLRSRAALAEADRDHAEEYAARLKATLSSLAIIARRVEELKAKHAGTAVTATEPVFGPMADALALTMRNQRFQLAVMNDTEPSARDVAAFESDLNNRRVKVLIYNSQASDKLTDRLRNIASKAKIPIVGVTETMPANISYQKWLLEELEMLDKAISEPELMSIIAFDNVTLQVGGHTVLLDVSFAIEPGEFIGVLGPNGAGKTTLMRAILGLLPPSAGTLRVFERAPQCGNPEIGYLPQLRTILPDLRVRGRDFIATSLGGERWGPLLGSRRERRMIEEMLDAVDARELATRPLSEMSGGERQRLLLAQALIGRPKLLLLDEPLISLDARRQEAAIDVVRRVCRERKITVLFSAHELNQLLGTLDRVLYLGSTQAYSALSRRP